MGRQAAAAAAAEAAAAAAGWRGGAGHQMYRASGARFSHEAVQACRAAGPPGSQPQGTAALCLRARCQLCATTAIRPGNRAPSCCQPLPAGRQRAQGPTPRSPPPSLQLTQRAGQIPQQRRTQCLAEKHGPLIMHGAPWRRAAAAAALPPASPGPSFGQSAAKQVLQGRGMYSGGG